MIASRTIDPSFEVGNRTGLRSGVCQGLVLALVMSSLPWAAPAQNPAKPGKPRPDKYQDNSCSLADVCSNNGMKAAIVGGIGGAAVVGLLMYRHHTHGGISGARLDAKPFKFGDYAAGQPVKLTVPWSNSSNVPISITKVAVDDKSGALALANPDQGTVTLAPGENYDIPLNLNSARGSGRASIRLELQAQRVNKKGVVKGETLLRKSIKVSWGESHKSHHLIPHR